MPGLKDISTVWKNVKEIDLKPIRDSATHPVRIALVGAQGAGRHTLAEQMRTDPSRPGIHIQTTVTFPLLDASVEIPAADLIIVLVDATRKDFLSEQALVKKWTDGGRNVLVFINKIDLIEGDILIDSQLGWQATRVIYGSVFDITFLQREFIPVVLELLPQQHLALGRQFPLFRLTIARQVINDTCFSNAAYSFSTGLAEIVPVLDIPLNVTDMIVLTKSQAFLAYKLGLLLGFSTNWQDYVTEFGSVIGGGFLWRQIARQLIGLIPAWGILPKVAIAYSGTYVVGNAILSWYLTGRHLSPKQMQALSVQAFARGRDYARKLGEKFPRPRLGKRKRDRLTAGMKTPKLNQGDSIIIPGDGEGQNAHASGSIELLDEGENVSNRVEKVSTQKLHQVKRKHISLRKKKKSSEPANTRTCTHCGKSSAADAGFCQYCGKQFDE